MSMGSSCKVEYLLYLAHDLGIMSSTEQAQPKKIVIEVKRMLTGLIKSVEIRSTKNY